MLFELVLNKTYINDEVQYTAHPSDVLISDFINANIIVDLSDDNETTENNFLTEQTQILFDLFQSMENVPLNLRNQYTL